MPTGAVIGFGNQGKQLLLAMAAAGIDVAAVCDTNPAAFVSKPPAKELWADSFPTLAEQGRLPRIYYDYQELLRENPGLDVVCVATWTQDHAPVAIAAAESGAKAILCEEPMATSLAGARAIIQACETRNVLLSVHHTRGWWPTHQAIKDIVERGRIGQLRSITISCGGERLGMLATHWIHFSRQMTGVEVASVYGWLGEITEPDPRGPQFRDFPGQILIVFQNGAKAFIEQGQGIALPPRYTIVGTTGQIFNDQLAKPPRENWQIWLLKDPNVSPVRNYMGEMGQAGLPALQDIDWKAQGVQALRELLDGKTICDGEDGYKTLEVLVAAHLSATGLPVSIPLSGDSLEYTLQHP